MSSLPFLGVGLSYRWELNRELTRASAGVDWLEVTPEHFLPLTEDARQRLRLLARRWPVAGHSLELSIGSEGVDAPGYLEGLREILSLSRSVWHGDHLCFTRVGEVPVRALTPVPLNEESVEICVRNIRRVQGELGRPFLVENIAWYLPHPLSTLEEAEFLRQVVLGADCGLLLDLHNLYANARNHGFDPYQFLQRIPLDRVVQIHLAGGVESEGLRIDTHSALSPREVWALLEHVVPRCPVRGINFEMDSGFPPFSALVEELEWARALLRKHGASGARV